MSDLVPNIPIYVSQAIERAMSIGQEQRFSTIEDLWFALNTPPVSGPSSLATEDISFISTISSDKTHQQVSQYAQPQRGSLLRTRRVLLPASLLLMLLVVFGGILSLWSYSRNAQPVRPIASSAGSSLNRSSGISTTPTVASSSYTRIKTSYAGTLHDLLADTSSSMSLTHIHQTNERITGSFTNHHAHSTFTGVLDGSQHIFFTVNGDDSHSSIFFEGAVRSDGNLAGNYCNVDKNGQCIGNYGLWSVSPSSA